MAKIWVVEDDEQLQNIICLVLEEDGHSVEVFSDGRSALAALAACDADLVVLDIGLPGLDGFDICKLVRDHPKHQTIPIVVVTGRHDSGDRYRMFVEGADDFLTKPFDSFELLVRIRNRLKRSPLRSQLEQEPLGVGTLELDMHNRQIQVGARRAQLTELECAILGHLLKHPGRAVATETLLVEALGYPRNLGNPDIVRTHIRHLREKIEADPSNPRILRNIPRLGYFIDASGENDSDHSLE